MENMQPSSQTHFLDKLSPFAKKLLLVFAGMVSIILFFFLPPNQDWFKNKILAYYRDLRTEKANLDLEHRKRYRFGSDYTYSKQIASFFEKKNNKTSALVLLPSTSYFKAYGLEYHVPEPAVFYYFTGLKTLWPNSTNAADAKWYVHASKGKIVVDSVQSRNVLLDTIAAFKKFDISL